jgi:hypothetical protein
VRVLVVVLPVKVARIVVQHLHVLRILQRDARNEPDPSVLKFWQPKIRLADGIAMVDKGTR